MCRLSNTIKVYNTPTQTIKIKNDAPVPELILQEKTITQNGNYTADSGYAGLSRVNVNVDDHFDFIEKLLTRSLEEDVELKVPDGIKTVGNYAFDNWYLRGKSKGLTKIDLNQVETIGQATFQQDQFLAEVNAPNLTMIGYDCFYYCIKLTRLYFPKVITANESNAFRDCQALKVLEFDSITSLQGTNFVRCYALDTLVIRTASVCALKSIPEKSNTPFYDGTLRIYVPNNLVEDYKVATNWAQFADQIRPLSEYVEV